jgi:hypothetical protein
VGLLPSVILSLVRRHVPYHPPSPHHQASPRNPLQLLHPNNSPIIRLAFSACPCLAAIVNSFMMAVAVFGWFSELLDASTECEEGMEADGGSDDERGSRDGATKTKVSKSSDAS